MDVFLFPGQGSHEEEMGVETQALRPDLFEAALAAAGDDPFARAAEATRFAQPAIVAATLARWSALGAPDGGVLLGHSLGELSALAAAGSLDEVAAVRGAAIRGRLMDDAGAVSPGGMLAVLKGDLDAAEALAAEHGLVVANDNAPGQVVLAGPRTGIEAARAAARDHGLRAMRLEVGGAFHSPAMAPAIPAWEAWLDEADLRPPQREVVSCLGGEPITDPATTLAAALTRPVRFRGAVEALAARGATRWIETGPGSVLANLVRRTVPDVDVVVPEVAARA
jgi:[acyl-carrier-protein] S-malonyltransferase